MGFIEDRIAEREKLKRESALIAESFDSLWDALWGAVLEYVNVYREKYGQKSVLTNGTREQHNITIPTEVISGIPMGVKSKVVIARTQGSRIITAGDQTFECRVCKDEMVCLTCNGEEISFKDAAARILDPLLFPELPRLS